MNNEFIESLLSNLKNEQTKEIADVGKLKTLLEEVNLRIQNRADMIKLIEGARANANSTVAEILGYRKV